MRTRSPTSSTRADAHNRRVNGQASPVGGDAKPQSSSGIATIPGRSAQRKVPTISDAELARRRQEVKYLKQQIFAARPHAADFRSSFSPDPQNVRASHSLHSTPVRAYLPSPLGKDQLSPAENTVREESTPQESPLTKTPTHVRKGHLDKTVLPRSFDTLEVENLRAKLGEMEAKLLSTQSQLIRERESARIAKARLAMELQAHIPSEDHVDLVRAKAALEQQFREAQESLHVTKSHLEYERKEKQLREVEVDRLKRNIANTSVQQTAQQSDGTVRKNSDSDANKIQELCKVNLTLLGQKRIAIKHIMAINNEIGDLTDLVGDVMDELTSAATVELADGMLVTENRALLMAQLQVQTRLRSTEEALQHCQDELMQLRLQKADANDSLDDNDRGRSKELVQERVLVEQRQRIKELEQEVSVLKQETADDMAKFISSMAEKENQVTSLRKALEHEQELSSAKLADLQEELKSVHERWMTEKKSRGKSESFVQHENVEGISIKLDMKMSEIENSVEFVQAVKLDVCSALGVSASRIQMHGVRAGSVIVDVALQKNVNPSDRTPGELLVDLLRQMKTPSSELLRGSMTEKVMSIEVFVNNDVYAQSIKPNDSSVATEDSTRSTYNWIDLVEQQTAQLRRQTADIVEIEHLNRKLTAELDEKEGAVMIMRKELDQCESDMKSFQESKQSLEEKLKMTEKDAENWKRAFSNLESQLNEHNELIKRHINASEERADDLERENLQLTAELSAIHKRYTQGSRDSFKSVETASSPTIIPGSPVIPNPKREIPLHTGPPRTPPRFVASPQNPSSETSSQPRSSPAPVLRKESDYDMEKRVDIRMNLEMSFEATGEPGSSQRETFGAQLINDLSNSSGLPPSSFLIQKLSRGGVLADVAVLPDPQGRGPEPIEVAVDLENQARDPKSRLRNGALTRHVREVTVYPGEHEEYKLIREENQRLREQSQNLRAQVLIGEAEIEEQSAKIKDLEQQTEEQSAHIKDLEHRIVEHNRMANTMQEQIDDSIKQLNSAQASNEELASRLVDADAVLKNAQDKAEAHHNLKEDLKEMNVLRQAKEDSDLMLEKVRRRNEELEAHIRESEAQVIKIAGVLTEYQRKVGDSIAREEEMTRQLSQANTQIHDLQVQGAQLARAKIFLEEKVANLQQMQDKQQGEFEAEIEKWKAKTLVVEDIASAVDQDLEKVDKHVKSTASLELQLNEVRTELANRDSQIAKLQEALGTTRAVFRSRMGIEVPEYSVLSFNEREEAQGDEGKIVPFGSLSKAQTHDDEGIGGPMPFRPQVQRSQMNLAAPHAPPGSPVSSSTAHKNPSGVSPSPPSSPLGLIPASTMGTRASTESPVESPVASPADAFVGRELSIREARVDMMVPDVKPTFPASQEISFFQTKPTYQGELKDGWPHGRGITVWPDGRVYDGHWGKGIFQGTGTCVWSNGDTYEGEWEEGFAHGLGKYTFFSTGDVFEGMFSRDKFHGHGVFASGNGVKFRGSWNHTKLTGWALVIGKNGEKLKQYYEDGMPSSVETNIPDDLYGRTLIAVSEVVKMVREQTVHLRQTRGVGEVSYSSPVKWDPTQGTSDTHDCWFSHKRLISNRRDQAASVRSSSPSRPPSAQSSAHSSTLASLSPNLRHNAMIPVDMSVNFSTLSANASDGRTGTPSSPSNKPIEKQSPHAQQGQESGAFRGGSQELGVFRGRASYELPL